MSLRDISPRKLARMAGAALFTLAAGIKAVHVPYRGSPESLTDLMSGRVQFILSPLPAVTPLIKTGRVPALAGTGIRQLINGPESFTPDGNFILGEAPELRNFFVGAGFNAFGIAAGGGAGQALAEWLHDGVPPYDLWVVDIRRFGRPHLDTDWVRTRTLEAYSKHYTMAWPFEEHHSGRPARVSPLYDRLLAAGASFGEKLGWERPNWFANLGAGESPVDQYTYGRQNWFEAVGREHRACREAAVLIDQTSFAKFALKGPDALSSLEWICANDVTKPVGSLTYTQMLDDRGGIQCDLTVARVARDEFYIVTGTGFATHDFAWIRRNIPADCAATLEDVTSARAVLALMGPRARGPRHLQPTTTTRFGLWGVVALVGACPMCPSGPGRGRLPGGPSASTPQPPPSPLGARRVLDAAFVAVAVSHAEEERGVRIRRGGVLAPQIPQQRLARVAGLGVAFGTVERPERSPIARDGFHARHDRLEGREHL